MEQRRSLLLLDTAFTFPASLLFSFVFTSEHLLRPLILLLLSFYFLVTSLVERFLAEDLFFQIPEPSDLRVARKYCPIFLPNHSISDETLAKHPVLPLYPLRSGLYSNMPYPKIELSSQWLSISGCTELPSLSCRSIPMHGPLLLCLDSREYPALQLSQLVSVSSFVGC